MTIMISEVYEAFKAGGTPEDKAKAAAEAIARQEERFNNLDTAVANVRADVAELRAEVKTDIAELRTELKMDMADLRTEVKTEIADLRTEMKTDMAELREEVKTDIGALRTEVTGIRTEMDMIKWLMGGIGFGVVLLVLRSFWGG